MLRKIAASTGIQMTSLALQLLDRFVLTALILRAWGVPAYEDWALLFAAAGLFNLLDLGLYQTLSNAYTRAYQSGDKAGFTRLMTAGVALTSAVALAGLAILAGLLAWGGTPAAVGVRTLDWADALGVFACFAASTILQTATACLAVVYRAQGRFVRGLARETAFTALRTLGVLAAVIAGAPPAIASVLYLGVTAVMLLVALPWDLRAHLDSLEFRPRWPNQQDWRMIAGAAPFFYAQHATTLLLLQLPTLVLGAFVAGAGGVAMFLFLRTLMNFARTLVQFVAVSVSVELGQVYAANPAPTAIAAPLRSACRLVCVITGAGLGLLWPASDTLAHLWSDGALGADWTIAAPLGLGLLLTGPFILSAAVLNHVGQEKICAASKLVNALTALALCVALVPHFGATGVAAALAAGEILGLGLVLLPASARLLGLSVARTGLTWAGWSLGACAATLVAMSLLLRMLPGDGVAQLALAVGLSAPLVGALVAGVGLSPENRQDMLKRVKPWLARMAGS